MVMNHVNSCNGLAMTTAPCVTLIVAEWYAQTYRMWFFVGHAVNKIDEICQQLSRRRVVRTGQNLAV